MKSKILYAAGNNINSKIQLQRFYHAIKDKDYNIKFAAYMKSSPSINIDWTLDCLLNVYDPTHQYLDNDNLRIYLNQIESYNPDLIISDLEYFTTYIGIKLNIPVWQCSSLMLNFSLDLKEKYNLGLYKKYSILTSKNPAYIRRIVNMIDNSQQKFVYSHLGDLKENIQLKSDHQWIRPYSDVGKVSLPCKHNIVANLIHPNKKIISKLKKYEDIVVFSEINSEKYNNINFKSFNNEIEYYCNLKNCSYFVCEGQASFLADAYYNGKKAIVDQYHDDHEAITSSLISERFNLSTFLSDNSFSTQQDINVNINNSIVYLHDKIDSFFKEKENILI